MSSTGLGRPRKYDKPLYFGMKVTPEEKAAIKKLAQMTKKPASQTIMALVQAALNHQTGVQPQSRISTAELKALSPQEQHKLLHAQAQTIVEFHEIDDYNEDIVDI